eukprot:4742410-Prymnesium_polylepis.1
MVLLLGGGAAARAVVCSRVRRSWRRGHVTAAPRGWYDSGGWTGTVRVRTGAAQCVARAQAQCVARVPLRLAVGRGVLGCDVGFERDNPGHCEARHRHVNVPLDPGHVEVHRQKIGLLAWLVARRAGLQQVDVVAVGRHPAVKSTWR